MTTPLEATVGLENQPGGHLKVQTFLINPEAETDQEVHLSQAHNTGTFPGFMKLNSHSTESVRQTPWEVGGGWTTSNFQIPDGTLLKLHLSRKRPMGIPSTCAVLYRARATAPLIQIIIEGLNCVSSVKTSVTALIGRLDRISLTEAKAAGYRPATAWERFFDSPDEEELIRASTLAPGESAPLVRVLEAHDPTTGETTYAVEPLNLRRIRRRPGR